MNLVRGTMPYLFRARSRQRGHRGRSPVRVHVRTGAAEHSDRDKRRPLDQPDERFQPRDRPFGVTLLDCPAMAGMGHGRASLFMKRAAASLWVAVLLL